MAKAGDYSISDIYQGGISSFDPEKAGLFTGYKSNTKNIGMSTDARTANIVKEVSDNLSAGAKTIELTQVSQDVFESIPKDQFDEVRRQAKLIGADVTFHAPVVEPSGMTQQGFTESNREAIERSMTNAVEKAHQLRPDGNIPVTFHSSAIVPGDIKPKGKEEVKEVFVVNSENGNMGKIPLKERHFPGEEKANIKNEIKKINLDSWSNQLTNLGYSTERAVKFIGGGVPFLKDAKKSEEKAGMEIDPREARAEQLFNIGKNYLNDSYRQLKDLYDVAYNKGSEKEKEKLKNLEINIQEKVNKINQSKKEIEKIELMEEVIKEGLKTLSELPPPEIYKPLNDFAREKTVETFGNVAFNSFKKFGDKSPIISIENPPAGGAFSTGEELKKIVEESKKKFVEIAIKEGISKSEAEKNANKLIGVTWDVGHINMLRKHGYDDKDIIKETEKVAHLVKHVHLSDNFGFEHTELPMGMGNVPIKEMMEKLGKKGYDGKKIIEALQWWQHFSPGGKQNPPLKPSFEAFGSPIYKDGVGPFWNQATGLSQGYYAGLAGNWLPNINYQTFGTGFAQLPAELGGQTPGAQGSRMSGRPME